jgi:acyl dehydratase
VPITLKDVEEAVARKPEPVPGGYTDRDTLLYALAIGMGRDPMDSRELEYVCETLGTRVVPTAATVLSQPRQVVADGGVAMLAKMNFALMLHGEQRLTLHRPLPPAAETRIANGTVGVYDKGAGKGALVVNETRVTLADGTPLYTLGSTLFFRGDGGFGGSAEGAPVPHPLPDRAPDAVCEMPGRRDQALLYALCGDRNPLHRDPGFAKMAGFDIPILHGLCSYGVACHAVLKTLLDYDQTRIRAFDVRFTSPVLPGETQVVEMWQDGKVISFRVRLKERGLVSINNGRCLLA